MLSSSFLLFFPPLLLFLFPICEARSVADFLSSSSNQTSLDSLSRLSQWLETAPPLHCQKQTKLPPLKRYVGAIVGPYNTGTNYMAAQLRENCPEAHAWQGWYEHLDKRNGKHTRVASLPHDKRDLLCGMTSLLMVRDPLVWMRSTCKKPYDLRLNGGCPRSKTKIRDSVTEHNVSDLMEWWNYFYQPYLEADHFERHPWAFVRYEDMLARPAEMTAHICGIFGFPRDPANISVTQSGHSPGRETEHKDHVKLSQKTRLPSYLLHGYTFDDLVHFSKVADPQLAHMFGYNWIELMNLEVDEKGNV